MYEAFAQVFEVQGPYVVPVATVLFVSIAGAVVLVARQVRICVTHRMDLDAKREMIDRGMSADQIERVLAAGGE